MTAAQLFRPALAAAGLSAALTACAPVAPPPGQLAAAGPTPTAGRQCFYTSRITGFRAAGDRAVNLRVSEREVYQVALFSPCPEVRGAERILVDSRAGGSSVCTGLDVEVIVPGAAGPRRCPASSLRRLAEAEVTALPANQRP